ARAVALAAFRRRAPRALVEPGVGPARGRHELGDRTEGGLPVEDDSVTLADDDGRAGSRPDTVELVLDTELLEPVGEVAHGFVVLEVGLLHPAHGLVAHDPVHRAVRAALDTDRELLLCAAR